MYVIYNITATKLLMSFQYGNTYCIYAYIYINNFSQQQSYFTDKHSTVLTVSFVVFGEGNRTYCRRKVVHIVEGTHKTFQIYPYIYIPIFEY